MIKTLVALVASMTLGTFTLTIMRTDPLQPEKRTTLAAMKAKSAADLSPIVSQTAIPLDQDNWQRLVVHSTGAEGAQLAQRCHFVIETTNNGYAKITATNLWSNQLQAVATGNDANEISVCLKGDFSQNRPRERTFVALIRLVRELQKQCNIRGSNVYLRSELPGRIASPGRAFPSQRFASHLLK